MSAKDPKDVEGSDSTPDRSGERGRLSYPELLDMKYNNLTREADAQRQLDRLWNEQLQALESERDQNPQEVSATLREIDAYKERQKELEARAAKGVERTSHDLEYLDILSRSNQNEGRKLMYDWFKHLTTLGTGSIVILGALSNNLLSDATRTWLIPPIFILLLLSVVAALIYMYLVSDIFLSSPSHPRSPQAIGWVFLCTLILFALGLALFIIFATMNL